MSTANEAPTAQGTMPRSKTQSVEICVIASPARITGGAAGALGLANGIVIRIENANLGNRTVAEPFLSPSFAQEARRFIWQALVAPTRRRDHLFGRAA
jgi:hypothetical protein